jgi:lipopolysaccharide/colanic/teichoic acid biosynthesis glycosyltransferase
VAPPLSEATVKSAPGATADWQGNRGFYARHGKRLADLALSSLFLATAALPMAVVGFLVLLCDGRPVLFRQERVGRWGQRFVLLKFRTMQNRDAHESTVTVAGDSRITKVGKWLRRWKLDELPQLLNVVRGDMSLVGPRPDVPGYWDQLRGDDRDLLALRPGITGPATLVFRREEEMLASADDPIAMNDREVFPRKIRLARSYACEMSLFSDLKWILYTLLPEEALIRRLRAEGWAA